MAVRIREAKNVTILDLDGRLDINSSDVIETVGWLTSTGKADIIINFESVDLVDYNGLSILAIAYKNIANHKGSLKLINVPLTVIELLKVVKLESVFDIYADEEAALNSFQGQEVERLHLRRKFTRLEMHLTVRYRLSGGRAKPRMFEGSVLNLSAAGLYIYSPHTFPVNTRLGLEFRLPGRARALRADGMVVWMADKEMQPHAYPGMGVGFVRLTPEKERAIIDFIDKNVTHRAEPV